MPNSLNFDINGSHYEISLIPTDQDSLNSVIIEGIKYTIDGEQEAVDLFKQKTRGLNLASIQVSELQNRLSLLEDYDSIPRIAKPNKLGMDILDAKQAINQTIKNKDKVLNELTPTWPIPGASPTASITDRMKELGVPGVRICVINNGKQEWSQGVGELAKPNTMIQAASISKTITALTVMTLIQEGLKTPKGDPLSLDTNIQDILDTDLWDSLWDSTPNDKKNQPITIRQLMSHTAGLERDTPTGYRGYDRINELEIEKTNSQIFELEGEIQKLKKEDRLTPDKEEIINKRIEELKIAKERAAKGELPNLDEIIKGKGTNSPPIQVTTEPDSPYAYSGGGAMILQKIIEIIAQTNDLPTKTYEGIVEEKIFDKLGMKNSGFSPKEHRTIQGNGEDGKPLPGKWVRQPELAAAGLWSTPEDLAKIAIGIQKSLLNEQDGIISKDLALQMMTPPTNSIEKIKKQISILEGKMKEIKDTHEMEKIEVELKDLRKKLLETQAVGLGVFIDKTSEATYFYHSGSNLGFQCLMVANDQGQGAIVMTNSEFGKELYPEIIRKIADTYNWKGKNSLNMLPPLHPEVVEASQMGLIIDSKEWAKNYQGKYENDRGNGAIVSVEVSEKDEKIYFRTPNPQQAPIEIIPVSEHVGIVKEDGRWFPIEFTKSEDQEFLALNIHGMNHIRLIRLNSEQKMQTITNIAKAMSEKYVFSEKGEECSRLLLQKLGDYEEITDPQIFAQTIVDDLYKITKDKHIRIDLKNFSEVFSFHPNKTENLEEILSDEDIKDFQPKLDKEKTYRPVTSIGLFGMKFLPHEYRCGFLENSPEIGYFELLKFGVCNTDEAHLSKFNINKVFEELKEEDKVKKKEELEQDVKARRAAYIDAIQHLKNAKAIIIDLRGNSGGDPSAVQLLCSLFMEENLPLNCLEWRTPEGFTRDTFNALPLEKLDSSLRLTNKPLYILGGPNTFSAGEEVMNNMKVHKRAITVGTPTAGGANPGGLHKINDSFEIFIPMGKAVNPIQESKGIEGNWEGVGIQPDHTTLEKEALRETIKLIESS